MFFFKISIRYLNRTHFFLESFCKVVCHDFSYDGIESDHTGWKQSTFLFVMKHIHKLFDEIRLSQGVEGRHDDPTSPYSTAMFGNALARIFVSKAPLNSSPIIFLSIGCRQREFYLKYIPFQPMHFFEKKSDEGVVAVAQRVEESKWLTHEYLKGQKDTLFKSYFCGIGRGAGNLADGVNILQFLIFKSLIFAYIDLLNKYPNKIRAHGSDVWKKDLTSIREHAFSSVTVYTEGRNYFISDYCFTVMFRDNVNKVVNNPTFNLLQIDEFLLIDNDNVRVQTLAVRAPFLYRYLCHLVNHEERAAKFANLHKLIKSRINEDHTSRFDIPLSMTSSYDKLDWLLDRAFGEYRHGVTPYCVQFCFLTGITTKKMLMTCYNIRKQYNLLRKEIADSKKRNDSPSVLKIKVHACTDFCQKVKFQDCVYQPKYLRLYQFYLADPRTNLYNQLSDKDFR